MNRYGHTSDFSVKDFIEGIEKFIRLKAFDFVIYNTKLPSKTLLKKYVDGGEPVRLGDEKINKSRKLIGADLLNKEVKKAERGDILQRTLIRHDSNKLAKVIMKILK